MYEERQIPPVGLAEEVLRGVNSAQTKGIEKRLRGYLERFQEDFKKLGKKLDIDYIVGKIMTPNKPYRSSTSGRRKKKEPLGNIHHPNYKGDNITR